MPANDHLGQQWWHGSPSGDLRGSHYGLHIGTRQSAEDALHARIGRPAEGSWDGSREYGSTLLNNDKTEYHGTVGGGFEKRVLARPPSLPSSMPQYSDGTRMQPTDRPRIDVFEIAGPMTNTPRSPHEDFKANGYMAGQIKRGRAKSGYFYENVSEDEGSISAVVPNGAHLRRPKAITDAATSMLGGKL